MPPFSEKFRTQVKNLLLQEAFPWVNPNTQFQCRNYIKDHLLKQTMSLELIPLVYLQVTFHPQATEHGLVARFKIKNQTGANFTLPNPQEDENPNDAIGFVSLLATVVKQTDAAWAHDLECFSTARFTQDVFFNQNPSSISRITHIVQGTPILLNHDFSSIFASSVGWVHFEHPQVGYLH